MKKTQFGTGMAVAGGAIAALALYKYMVVDYYRDDDTIYLVLALLGAFVMWLGHKVHVQGKMAGGEATIDSFADAVTSLKDVIRGVTAKENRGNIKERYERYGFESPTNLTFDQVLAIADQAATRATPMGAKFKLHEKKEVGGAQVGEYVLREGVMRNPTGVFHVTYEAAGADGLATVSVTVEDAEQSRTMLFWVIPFGPVTSSALEPYKNFTQILAEQLDGASRKSVSATSPEEDER